MAQLREAVEEFQRRHCEVFHHNFGREMLVLEVDLTSLSASGSAEGSTKGYFPRTSPTRGVGNWRG